MTEHLPECPWTTECPATGPHEFIPNQVGQIWCYKCTSTECQCEILRACSVRVMNAVVNRVLLIAKVLSDD